MASHAEDNVADYANWMRDVPFELTQQPINNLAVPGSHDSFSYSISRNSDIAPDDATLLFLNRIPFVRTIAKKIVYRWSVTETATCSEQLEAGIRYLDLRVAVNTDTLEICLVHGLYGIAVKEALGEILHFLQAHPKEIVFIDFQHFYSFTNDTHEALIQLIREVFGPSLCPFDNKLNLITLSWLWQNGYQIFVFYRNDICHFHDHLWPGLYIPNPWPNTVDIQQMIDFLESNYQKGKPKNKFYVTQGVLTPDNCYVCLHLTSTLKNTLVKDANPALMKWLQGKHAGPLGINIVMFDFAHENTSLVKQVINMNYESQINIKQ